MATKKQPKVDPYENLKKFIAINKGVVLRTADLRDPASNPSFKWTGFKKGDTQLIQQLQAYQRLLQVVPAGATDLVFDLLAAGFDSAVKIAAIPLKHFIADYKHLTKDLQVLEVCHQNAVAIRSQLLLHYLNKAQGQVFPQSGIIDAKAVLRPPDQPHAGHLQDN